MIDATSMAHRGTESSISFSPLQNLQGIITPNGLFFERLMRDGRNRSGIAPADDPRPGRAAADLSMEDIVRFPSVSRIHFIECPANGGMEWRGAQLESLQFTHGMISCADGPG